MWNKKKYDFTLSSVLWLFLSAVVIAIVAFCHFPDDADWKWCIPLEGRYHLPMILGGSVVVAIIALLCGFLCRTEYIRRGRLLMITCLLTLTQIILLYSYYVYTDWDVQQVTGLAQAMAEGRSTEDFSFYFLENSNNLFLSRIFALVFFVTGPLWGLKTTLFPLLVIQCIGCGATALMFFQTAMHLFRRKSTAVTAYILYILLIGFSPWWSIPYSDIWGLMLSVSMLWLATTLPFRRRWIKILIIGAASALGYYIKPQTLFVPLSVITIRFIAAVRRKEVLSYIYRKKGFWRLVSSTVGVALGGVATGVLLVHLAVAGSGMHLHTSKAFSASHYLMMGANYQSIGIYSAQDVDFSRSFPNKRERHKAELSEMAKRYGDLGIDGTLLLWGRKNLLNFSDGTFYWGREGSFYKIVPERSGWLANTSRNIYYNRAHIGKYHNAWSIASTAVWFGIMLFSFIAALPRRRTRAAEFPLWSKKRKMDIDIVFMAVTMLTLFHTLCEARARYLFCFIPLFILLAAEGTRILFPVEETMKLSSKKQ